MKLQQEDKIQISSCDNTNANEVFVRNLPVSSGKTNVDSNFNCTNINEDVTGWLSNWAI